VLEYLDLLYQKLEITMSLVSEYLAKQAEFNAAQADTIDSLVASQAGLVSDVQSLNDKITTLQNSPGTFTAADQVTADAIQAQGQAMATKLKAVADALAALDASVPPVVPPVTPEASAARNPRNL